MPYTGGSDTLTLRNARAGSDILTIAMWTLAQVAGFTQVIAPSAHDMVRNFRYRTQITAVHSKNVIPRHFPLNWKPQDPLTITNAGSAVAGDIELVHMLNWYEDLPGVEANLINVAELRNRGVDLLTYEDSTIATSGTTYTGARAINAASDLYKADTEYAILGITYSPIVLGVGSVAVRGVDTGNLRCGIPVALGMETDGRDWFAQLSDFMDIPCIPVFNSANRAGTFIDVSSNENFATFNFALHLCQLAPRAVRKNASFLPGTLSAAAA